MIINRFNLNQIVRVIGQKEDGVGRQGIIKGVSSTQRPDGKDVTEREHEPPYYQVLFTDGVETFCDKQLEAV